MRRWAVGFFLVLCLFSSCENEKSVTPMDDVDEKGGSVETDWYAVDIAPYDDSVESGQADVTADSDLTSGEVEDSSDSTSIVDTFHETLPVSDAFVESFEPYPDDVVVTTLLQTLRPRYGYVKYTDEDGHPLVPVEEFGKLFKQPGESHILRNELGVQGNGTVNRKSLAYFLHLSDPQVMDCESPAAIPANDVQNLGGFTAVSYADYYPYHTQFYDALVQTANRFDQDRPFDFVAVCGDISANAQKNELLLSITVLDGGIVNSDSGADEDPIPGPVNDPRDPFYTPGLDPDIPRFAVIGNHDIGVNGNFPPGSIIDLNSPEMVEASEAALSLMGLILPGVGTADFHRNFLPVDVNPAFLILQYPFQLSFILTSELKKNLEPATIDSDENRAYLDTCSFVALHRSSVMAPNGFGFTAENETNCTGFYRADPIPGIPLRILALDTGPDIGGSPGSLHRPLNPDGTIDTTREGDPAYDQVAWLLNELEQAKQDNVAVIMMSHHSSDSLIKGNDMESLKDFLTTVPIFKETFETYFITPQDAVAGWELRDILLSYPNVILHLAGHWHRNAIQVVCPDGSMIREYDAAQGSTCALDPLGLRNGYYEIITASPGDYPHEARIVEIVDNGDGTGSIFTTIIDAQGGSGSLFTYGRFLSFTLDRMSGSSTNGLGPRWARNTEILFKWPDSLKAKLTDVPAPTRIESLTTLKEPAQGLPYLPLNPP